MNKNRRYTLYFLILGVAAVSGMGLKSIIQYSPTIGWGLGFVFFVISSYFACKLKQESTN